MKFLTYLNQLPQSLRTTHFQTCPLITVKWQKFLKFFLLLIVLLGVIKNRKKSLEKIFYRSRMKEFQNFTNFEILTIFQYPVSSSDFEALLLKDL